MGMQLSEAALAPTMLLAGSCICSASKRQHQ